MIRKESEEKFSYVVMQRLIQPSSFSKIEQNREQMSPPIVNRKDSESNKLLGQLESYKWIFGRDFDVEYFNKLKRLPDPQQKQQSTSLTLSNFPAEFFDDSNEVEMDPTPLNVIIKILEINRKTAQELKFVQKKFDYLTSKLKRLPAHSHPSDHSNRSSKYSDESLQKTFDELKEELEALEDEDNEDEDEDEDDGNEAVDIDEDDDDDDDDITDDQFVDDASETYWKRIKGIETPEDRLNKLIEKFMDDVCANFVKCCYRNKKNGLTAGILIAAIQYVCSSHHSIARSHTA
jgi:hypothetical protein